MRKRAGPLIAAALAALAVAGGARAAPPPVPYAGSEEIACVGDACQPPPEIPVDPTLTTSVHGAGNPPVHFVDHTKCKQGRVRRAGKCVKRKHHGRR